MSALPTITYLTSSSSSARVPSAFHHWAVRLSWFQDTVLKDVLQLSTSCMWRTSEVFVSTIYSSIHEMWLQKLKWCWDCHMTLKQWDHHGSAVPIHSPQPLHQDWQAQGTQGSQDSNGSGSGSFPPQEEQWISHQLSGQGFTGECWPQGQNLSQSGSGMWMTLEKEQEGDPLTDSNVADPFALGGHNLSGEKAKGQ